LVTDGTSFWVVDGSALKVFKYTLSGSLLGSWSIDPADTHPTGITINPNNVSDIWIVDNGTDKVYQYVAAAGRNSGSQNAAATFALNPYDTSPQGIADPPSADMLLTQAAGALAPIQPSVAALGAVSAVGPSGVAGVPALAGRDALFALSVRESLQEPDASSLDLAAVEALTPHLGSLPLTPDRAWVPVGASGGQRPPDAFTPLTPGSIPGARTDRSAAALLDGPSADEGPASAWATDSFFAGLAEDAPAED
jgi:hypothetical protein